MQRARVIDFGEAKATVRKKEEINSLDAFFVSHGIIPDCIACNLPGYEVLLFSGTQTVIQKFKPRIVLTCEERRIGREKVLQVFEALQAMGYKGSFLLDNISIPLENFYFDMYQSPTRNFYCSTFVFV